MHRSRCMLKSLFDEMDVSIDLTVSALLFACCGNAYKIAATQWSTMELIFFEKSSGFAAAADASVEWYHFRLSKRCLDVGTQWLVGTLKLAVTTFKELLQCVCKPYPVQCLWGIQVTIALFPNFSYKKWYFPLKITLWVHTLFDTSHWLS